MKKLFHIVIICTILTNLLCGCQFKQPKKEDSAPLAPVQVSQEINIALILPSQGAYSPISTKISRGAMQGHNALKQSGIETKIHVLNAESPDWVTKLASLPDNTIVGGVIAPTHYTQAKASGLLDKKTFFCFLSALEGNDEGTRAWRFFPSPQDQVDALLAFGTGTLNIRSYGAFYPNDTYGLKMTTLFEQTVTNKGMILYKAPYTPDDTATWADAIAPLIKPKNEGSVVIPQTPFAAIFLPDSWKNMDQLTNSLILNGETRLILMGTTLWEQGLSGRILTNPSKYNLAVFPSAWNPANAPNSLKGPGNDFWTALGYDFIQFASKLNITQKPSAQEMPSKASAAAASIKILAPITWDQNGIAHQQLSIFQPTETGTVPLNLETFNSNRAKILNNTTQNTTTNTVNQNTQTLPLSNTPQPSYKLRLPN